MKLEVKVSYRRSHQMVTIETDSIVKARKMAIEKVTETSKNIAFSDCTTEITSGITTAIVTFMVKPITKRRMTAECLNEYAERLGLKKQFINFGGSAYYWGEKEVEQLKQILKDEKN